MLAHIPGISPHSPKEIHEAFSSLLMYNMGPIVAQHLGCRLFLTKILLFVLGSKDLLTKETTCHTQKTISIFNRGLFN